MQSHPFESVPHHDQAMPPQPAQAAAPIAPTLPSKMLWCRFAPIEHQPSHRLLSTQKPQPPDPALETEHLSIRPNHPACSVDSGFLQAQLPCQAGWVQACLHHAVFATHLINQAVEKRPLTRKTPLLLTVLAALSAQGFAYHALV